MRILVSTTPGAGHVNPVVPLARALRELGHDVTWATAASACDGIAAFGFDVRPAGMGLEERLPRFFERRPDILSVPPPRRRPIMFATMFAELAAPATLPDLARIVDEVHPDLVVHELAELAAAPLAASRGIPVVTVAFSGALPVAVRAALGPAIEPVWSSVGLAVPDDLGMGSLAYLHPFPPSFGQRPSWPTVRDVRPTSDDRSTGSEPPDWLDRLGRERPLVYVTYGTEMSPAAPWPVILDGLGALDVDALVTVGAQLDPAALRTGVPAAAVDRIRIERYVPQSFVLGRAAAVVSHGGAGTVLAAAAEGVPQVVMPLGADQFDNADAVVSSGIGRRCDVQSLTVDHVASALRAVLDAGGPHRAAAAGVAAEIAAMPPPDSVAAVLSGAA